MHRPLPPLIATRDGHDIVRLWNCAPVPDPTGTPVYRISPCTLSDREHELYEVPGLMIDNNRHRHHSNGYAVLVTDTPPRRYSYDPVSDTVIYRGDWIFMERSLHSWYHGAPIPVVEFVHHGGPPAWPRHTDANVMVYRFGERRDFRRWLRRWDPDRAEEEVQPPPVVAPAAPPQQPVVAPAQPITPVQPLPKFVAELLITDAIAKSSVCPITMEPITTATAAAATSCFHVFDADAIAIWLTNDDRCPTCKTRCVAQTV